MLDGIWLGVWASDGYDPYNRGKWWYICVYVLIMFFYLYTQMQRSFSTA